jgi:membrane fusion protein (multidrug efflux system)
MVTITQHPQGRDKETVSSAHPSASTSTVEVQQLEAVPGKRRAWVVILAIIMVVGIVVATVSYLSANAGWQSTDDAYVEGRIVRISPKVSGQAIALYVDDNDPVTAGQVLLRIDPVDYQAKVDQAVAAVLAGQSAVEQARANVVRAQAAIGEAGAAARAAQTEADRRASDYRRYKEMGTDGVSEQELETAQHASDAANAQRDAAIKKQDAAAADLNVARTNVDTAQAQLAAAQAQLRFAQLQLQYTKVIAPDSGKVANRNIEQGNFVSTGQPLLAIVPDERWVIANFKEVQLEKMRVGQPAEVRVDAFPGVSFKARVQSLQSGTGSRFELLPPENATGNWVKVVQRLPVKIVFDPGQPGLERLAQGMSVEVAVDTREGGTP